MVRKFPKTRLKFSGVIIQSTENPANKLRNNYVFFSSFFGYKQR